MTCIFYRVLYNYLMKTKEYHPSESEIQKQILDYLKWRGIFHWRNNVGRKHNLQFGLKGSADIMGVTKNGIFFAIEVKDWKGKPTPEQKAFEKKVNNNNAVYVLARDVYRVKDIL